MAVYAAHYETSCMTRQHLERLAAEVHAAAGDCRSRQFFVSLTGGHLVWLFTAPGREPLDDWLTRLRMANYQWLARVDYEGDGATLRDA